VITSECKPVRVRSIHAILCIGVMAWPKSDPLLFSSTHNRSRCACLLIMTSYYFTEANITCLGIHSRKIASNRLHASRAPARRARTASSCHWRNAKQISVRPGQKVFQAQLHSQPFRPVVVQRQESKIQKSIEPGQTSSKLAMALAEAAHYGRNVGYCARAG
jgi:hypothetical protein